MLLPNQLIPMKSSVSVEIIVAIFLAVIVVGFVVMYFMSRTSGDVQQTEIRAQVARCCSVAVHDGAVDTNALCIDDSKLIRAINKYNINKYGENAKTYTIKNPPPLEELINIGYVTELEIESICGVK